MTILRPISILLLLACSCDRPTAKYGAVDQPDPIPQPKAAPPPKVEEAKAEPGTSAEGACTRGTGRNGAGECVPLATRKLERVQQVQIPAGEFVVGDAPDQYDFGGVADAPKVRWSGQPPRMAKTEGFWIDMHEVTREAYQACVTAKKCTAPKCDPSDAMSKVPGPNRPAVPQTCVTHSQAQAYCAAQGGRLPTEIEWEYAARGVDARLYPWGSEPRDEYMLGLMPVTMALNDNSYFGLAGMGTSAVEWVADEYDIGDPLSAYAPTPFRAADGPLMRALGKQPKQHVFKSARVGARYPEDDADASLGFRCAADLDKDVVRLTVPVAALPIPLVREAGSMFLFGGIAEAVSHTEAEAFCAAVSFKWSGQTWSNWRLPTLAEVNSIIEIFRGPGPFWSATDGPIAQVGVGATGSPTEPWVSVTQAEGEDIAAARCVHDPLPPEPPR